MAEEEHKSEKKSCRVIPYWCILSASLFVFSLALYFFARNNTYFTEKIYAEKIYRVLSVVINNVTGIFPFSVIEIIILLLPAALILIAYLTAGRMGKEAPVLKKTAAVIVRYIGIAAFLASEYILLCGINYYRMSFAESYDIPIREHTADEFYEMCLDLARRTTQAREEVTELDDEGAVDTGLGKYALAKRVAKEFNRLSEEYPLINGHTARPKPLLLSRPMSYTHITGIYMPFTVEANVDADLPETELIPYMAHEMAHVSGFMREDEANYIAYLACSKSEDPTVRYCGLLFAFDYAVGKFYSRVVSKDDSYYDEYREIYAQISDDVWKDENRIYEYWEQFEESAVSEAADRTNDAYLKMNGQSDGTRSYGRMVDLLLGEYDMKK